jgi:GNAT superfamily N-acetyltransferase
MSPSYEIIRYRPEFRDQVLELQKHLWSGDASFNAEYFSWKYERNPYVDDIPIYLAVFDRQVVGMRGMMGAEWQVGASSQTFRCLCACDLVVTPSHRGRGLFRKIMAPAMEDLALRGHPLVFNLSASPITFLSSLKAGWRLAGTYRPWRWQTRSKALARGIHRWMHGRPGFWRYENRRIPLIEPVKPAALQRLADHFDRASSRGETGFRFGTEAEADPMIALAQRLTPDDGRIRHRMDRTYLGWRYGNPQSQYGFLYAGSDPLKGYLVLHAKRLGDPHDVAIVDWQADDVDVLRDMVHAVQRSGAVDSLTIWSATLDESALSMLRSLRFSAFDDTRGIDGFTPGVIFGATNGQTPAPPAGAPPCDFSGLAGWDLRMIYSDYY